MKNTFVQVFFCIASLVLTGVVHAADCPQGEALVAQCVLPGKQQREALICYGKGKKKASLKYYFLKGNNTELEVDFSKTNQLQRWLDEGTYTRYFGFFRGEYSYVIGVPEPRNSGSVAFLEVRKNSQTISEHSCSNISFGDKDVLHPFIKNVDDEIVRDTNEFPLKQLP